MQKKKNNRIKTHHRNIIIVLFYFISDKFERGELQMSELQGINLEGRGDTQQRPGKGKGSRIESDRFTA